MQTYLIEQEVARRCGPFFSDVVADSGAAFAYPTGGPSLSAVVLPTLQSSLELGDQWTGRYLLRRGLLQNSAGVVSLLPTSTPPNNLGPYFPTGTLAADRIRRVASVDYTSGTVTPDRPWTNYPASNELIELHYLDPDRELKIATLRGLDRCYVEDRTTLTLTGQATERDVTALASWLTQRDQIKNVQWNFPGTFQTAMDVRWFNPFLKSGHVWLSISPDPYPNTILVTARRPASTAPTLSATYGTVTSCSLVRSTPEVITTFVAHGLVTGDVVLPGISPESLQAWTITVIDSTHFSLDGSVGDGTGTPTITTFVQVFYADDLADYPVILDYAAAAGHIAAWQRFPGRLIGGAQVGLFATQKEAAEEFSAQTDKNYIPTEPRVEFDSPFPSYPSIQRA